MSKALRNDEVIGTIPNGDAHPELNGGEEEQQVPASPVTIRLPSPTRCQCFPKGSKAEEFTTLTLLPQAYETIQELKLAVNDWVGGYWLGPYSLRIPGKGGKANRTAQHEGDVGLLTKGKDGVVVREGERLSEWLEVGDVFGHVEERGEKVLEVVREPYSEFSARQTVLRLLELIAPAGTSTHTLSTPIALSPGSTIYEAVRGGTASSLAGPSSAVYEGAEVPVANGWKGKGGKKEVVKIKREVSTAHAFADWKGDGQPTPLSRLPMSQPLMESLPCVESIQLSPFNPPPPHLRQAGHQLYLQVTTLEGTPLTLLCTSRGWYQSPILDPIDTTPTSSPTHSLIDLLHSVSPRFSERLALLPPLTTTPSPLEPISTVPIPQVEPAYPWLATPIKPTSDILRTQLAYLHTGATVADSLDAARDWNEEIQGIKELPRESMQERVIREKMAQKTWAEFTQASVRGVLAVARGDKPPLNPNEDARAHMWLTSNIFITKAIDSIDAYAHLGGDAAAHVSHAKDAAGVKSLNKLDVEGVHLLGHTVIDWHGERWVCQSMLPGIFSRPRDEEVDGTEKDDKEEEKKVNGDAKEDGEKKEDRVKVKGHSPNKSTESAVSEKPEEFGVNPMIIYGLDSEHLSSIHWDASTHKVMSKIASAYRLAEHKVKDGNGDKKDFYASAEVKALRGTDGRRYLLDLPRLAPVDVEWLEKDMEGKDGGEAYPHRVMLLRPELVETFWDSELKRWAREVAEKEKEADKEGDSSAIESCKANGDTPAIPEDQDQDQDRSLAAAEAVAHREEGAKPIEASPSTLKQFELRFNPDAFVDQPPPNNASDKSFFVPSATTDESDPAIKAVRDASVFLRQIAIPAIALDVLTGNTSGIMDGQSLSKHLHSRGVNMRYLGMLAGTIQQFSAGLDGKQRPGSGHLAALKGIVIQEMVFRASKHVLWRLVRGLQPEHVPCAISHFLNCLLGTGYNTSPSAIYQPMAFSSDAEPAYVGLTPESLRAEIRQVVKTRFRWTLDETYLTTGLRKQQLLRELAMRFAFQLMQRDYTFVRGVEKDSDDDKENRPHSKEKDKAQRKSKAVPAARVTTFEPIDVLTLVPVVRSTAPSASVAEEIFEAGRATINRGNLDLGLEFLLESVQLYENIHSVIHPEVAAAYNQYASTIHQLARLKISQVTDPDQPLGLDIGTALRLQRQAVIIAERTVGVWHAETLGYYFSLAMLENLEGNAGASLRYFRHVLEMWEVIHGLGHPEISTVLSNAGVVLQTLSEHSLSLRLLLLAQSTASKTFGPTHIQNAQALHHLTQAHFLSGDFPSALSTSEEAYAIFTTRLGVDHAQTKEVGKNVELLKAVVENVKRQKVAREKSHERIRAVAGSSRRRLAGAGVVGHGLGGVSATGAGLVNGGRVNGGATGVIGVEGASRIGERGHLDVDELVKFIGGFGTGKAARGKNSLRGKRRTGAKR